MNGKTYEMEYKKYQAQTLSSVEQAYLETIKTVQKKGEKEDLSRLS